ncbi:MAG: hypothetical protein IPL12_11625 [Bacteroidetes bacterium]|nr:hypothetical protein [Bacteroidota bacterium]
MKIAKIVVGLFLIFAAFQGIPEEQSMSDLEGGALYAFILMLVVGFGLLLWGLNQNSRDDSKTK